MCQFELHVVERRQKRQFECFEKELQIGDEIILEDMIHYTMVKTTTFNGVNLPSIGKLDKKEQFHLLKSFGYESFKDRL